MRLYTICLIWNLCILAASVLLILKFDSAWWALLMVLVTWPSAGEVRGLTADATRGVRKSLKDSAS